MSNTDEATVCAEPGVRETTHYVVQGRLDSPHQIAWRDVLGGGHSKQHAAKEMLADYRAALAQNPKEFVFKGFRMIKRVTRITEEVLSF